jgi:hypothetical protein
MSVEVFLQRTLNIEPPFQSSKIPAVIALVQATVGDEMQFGCPEFRGRLRAGRVRYAHCWVWRRLITLLPFGSSMSS